MATRTRRKARSNNYPAVKMTSWRKSVIGETKNTAQLQGDKKLEIKTLPKEATRKSVSSHFEAISLCLNELVIHSVLLLPLRNIPSGTLRKTSTSPRLKISFEGTKTRWRKFTQHGVKSWCEKFFSRSEVRLRFGWKREWVSGNAKSGILLNWSLLQTFSFNIVCFYIMKELKAENFTWSA